MGSLPRRFWITMGHGLHPEHQINAYDEALHNAGICDQNMCMLSSVPPSIMIHPVINHGMTYVPMPADSPDAQEILAEKFRTVRLRQGRFTRTFLPLDSSWILDLVLARTNGNQFDRITSSIGLVWYETPTGKGIYAVEDDGNKSIDGSIDNCSEMLQRMVKMRRRKFVYERGHRAEHVEKIHLRTVISPLEKKTKLDVQKVVWHSHHPKMQVHTISINEIPEGYVGTVISAAVMDPFTEIH